jgi:hypothetical protein
MRENRNQDGLNEIRRIMNRLASNGLILTLLWLPASVMAEQAGGNWLQLNRLNQANQQELQSMHREISRQREPASTQTQRAWEQLQRQQRMEQRALQQSQQQQRLLSGQRHRVSPSSQPQRLEGLFQQQRFQQAQDQQLQRFGIQQQLYAWPR